MSSREIHTLNGTPLGATRWTSTSAHWANRAPFGGRGGLSEMAELDACACNFEGLEAGESPSSPPVTGGFNYQFTAKEGETPCIELKAYVMSQGPLNPQRLFDAVWKSLAAGGFKPLEAPTVKSYPLTWQWEFQANDQLYASVPVGKSSGPFVQRLQKGFSFSENPTAAETRNLPSVGSVIVWPKIKLGNAKALLDALRRNVRTATAGSNVNYRSFLIKTFSIPTVRVVKKKVNPVAVVAGGSIALLIGMELLQRGAQVSRPGM